ncbi:unnamed protein product [Amaranthus hypochondriacus]
MTTENLEVINSHHGDGIQRETLKVWLQHISYQFRVSTLHNTQEDRGSKIHFSEHAILKSDRDDIEVVHIAHLLSRLTFQ